MNGAVQVSVVVGFVSQHLDKDMRTTAVEPSSVPRLEKRGRINDNAAKMTIIDKVRSVLTAEERNETEDSSDREVSVFAPTVVTGRVSYWLQKWGRTVPVPPDRFLMNILTNRGYDSMYISSVHSASRRQPTFKQLQDYDHDIVWAVRNSDLEQLISLNQQGRSMTACNRFSESIVHMACRRASAEVVQYLIAHDAEIDIVDDYGRTPLHDACWRPEPRFDIVTLLLDANLDLLRYQDARGFIPLQYVREDHWLQWCAYLFNQIEKYWAPRPVDKAGSTAATATVESHATPTTCTSIVSGNGESDEPVAKRQRVDDQTKAVTETDHLVPSSDHHPQ